MLKAACKVGLIAAFGVLTTTALPEWSWDTIQTYVHCANFTGEWNAEVSLSSKIAVVLIKTPSSRGLYLPALR